MTRNLNIDGQALNSRWPDNRDPWPVDPWDNLRLAELAEQVELVEFIVQDPTVTRGIMANLILDGIPAMYLVD